LGLSVGARVNLYTEGNLEVLLFFIFAEKAPRESERASGRVCAQIFKYIYWAFRWCARKFEVLLFSGYSTFSPKNRNANSLHFGHFLNAINILVSAV
jgi:hypothetical protein